MCAVAVSPAVKNDQSLCRKLIGKLPDDAALRAALATQSSAMR